jgi:hypothetical protein
MKLITLTALLLACSPSSKEPPDLSSDTGDREGISEIEDDCVLDDGGITGARPDNDCDGIPADEDCDDENPLSNHRAIDGDCDGLLRDDDCDDDDPEAHAILEDADCDGLLRDDDCDDDDPEAHAILEDADCDGLLRDDDCDDDDPEAHAILEDADCDGLLRDDDCDDDDPGAHAILEDADCDGTAGTEDCDDEEPTLNQVDHDRDGFTSCDGDCVDDDGSTYPGAASLDDSVACMTDADGDGWGDPSPIEGVTSGSDCDDSDTKMNHDDSDEDGHTSCAGDCDDAHDRTFIGAALREAGALCMRDADADGWGDASPPPGVSVGLDCDDEDPVLNPADADGDGDSSCHGDCDDLDATRSSLDLDEDGVSTCEGDCDDADSTVLGGDVDDDFDGYSACDGDCDDSDASIYPGAVDIRADGIDQDCDGTEVRWSQVSLSYRQACALDTEGAIHCWGDDIGAYDWLGGILSPPSGTFSSISITDHHACAIEAATNEVTCWGDCVESECDPPSGAFDAVIAAGRVNGYYDESYSATGFSCGIRRTGAVTCWGGPSSPVADFEIPDGTFTQLSGSDSSVCGLKTDGSIHCWGDEYESTPQPILGTFSTLSHGGYLGCAIAESGDLMCWDIGPWAWTEGTWDHAWSSLDFSTIYVSEGYTSYGRGLGCGTSVFGAIDCWGEVSESFRDELYHIPLGEYADITTNGKDWVYGRGVLWVCALRTDGLLDCFGGGDGSAGSHIASDAPPHSG